MYVSLKKITSHFVIKMSLIKIHDKENSSYFNPFVSLSLSFSFANETFEILIAILNSLQKPLKVNLIPKIKASAQKSIFQQILVVFS